MAHGGGDDRGAEPGRDADADAADGAADGDVPEHALCAMFGAKVEDDGERDEDEHADVREEAGRDKERLELGDLRDGLFLRAIEGDDDRSDLSGSAGGWKIGRDEDGRGAMDGKMDGARTMQRPQPSQPKKVSFSLRKKEERMAEMTTERAPIGVYL